MPLVIFPLAKQRGEIGQLSSLQAPQGPGLEEASACTSHTDWGVRHAKAGE